MQWYMKWDTFNRNISMAISKNLSVNERSINIISYGINVLINGIEKSMVLISLFAIQGLLKLFFVAFMMIACLRMWMGGTHRNSLLACVSQSYVVFMSIIIIYKLLPVNVYATWLIMFVTIIINLLFCPIISKKRGKCSESRKRKFKIMGVIGIIVVNVIQVSVLRDMNGMVQACEIVQIIDVLIALIFEERREVKNER